MIIKILTMFLMLAGSVFAQTVESARLVRSLRTVRNEEAVTRKVAYDINCRLTGPIDSTTVSILDNWTVLSDNQAVSIESVLLSRFDPTRVKIQGEFGKYENLTISFAGQQPVPVTVDPKIAGTNRWRFGKGKPVDFRFRRLAEQQSKLAFDYDFSTHILERFFSFSGSSFRFRSVNLELRSAGTFGSDEYIRNGTKSLAGLSVQPYYFAGGLIYQNKLHLGYQLETRESPFSGSLLEVINKAFVAGARIEIPYSNYPIFLLHQSTGYVRLAMPLILEIDYLFEGKGEHGYASSARLDFRSVYELALSPYLILQGEWHLSKFFDVPSGIDEDAVYYSVTIAQDLDVMKENFELLETILGKSKKARGKHFIFYRISSGKKAPAFQDLREHSFGFGFYL